MAIVVLSITQLVFYLITAGGAVFISKDAHDLLQGVLNEFGKDPENPCFHHVLLTSDPDCKILPKIFIWCPITHF